MASSGNSTAGFRVLTANIQSFPESALTLSQAEEDLRRNADVADIVLLQEIAKRYQGLVKRAFPAAEWEVFFGADDNSEPIAFRRSMFRKLEGRAILLHPARAGLHFRRHTTYLHLMAQPSGLEFHVTNLHMVAGAFAKPPRPRRAERVKEWNDGIAKHLTFIDSLVEKGDPVLGGGDYNRQLKRHPSLGGSIDGELVKYAVDQSAIDLLWFIDGDRHRWSLRSRKVFAGREGKRPQRNSDHAARLATVVLSKSNVPGIPFLTPGKPAVGSHNGTSGGKKVKAKNKPPTSPEPGGTTPDQPRTKWPKPFEKTTFGDIGPKVVDWKTRAALEEAERLLGYRLTIVKGSYNTTDDASKGTHDKGGVVDLRPFDHERKVQVLRSIGFAAWRRLPSEGPWKEHIHAVLIDHGNLSAAAKTQVAAYRKGRNGLKNNAVDRTPRPHPIPVFTYPPKREQQPDPAEGHANGHANGHVGAGHQAGSQPRPLASSAPYPPHRMLDGVDTSHHQSGRIDLRKAQHAGLRWWYVKATDGETTVDETYRKRIKEARNAGVPVGSYHFARPDGGDAVKEAQHFLETARIQLGDMLPMLDLEGRAVLSREQLTRWVGVWVTTVRRDLAKRGLMATPVIYTPFDLDDAFGCKLWVARYSDDFREPRIPEPWTRAAIWQHSNGKVGPIRNVPGFGPVDVNAMHPDLPLSALRVRRPRGGDDLDRIRRDLQAAMKRLDDALDRLPERSTR
ncbi:MAG TPA: glycoside hydrolase family 25 protein [Nocardioides sp.]|uniref:glycoside hydrolase family 25 protein n=1 Tax=Nocardioides sp. TaxID=35761 RepID=UPI002E32A42B|nr:glycoside hydrolase family 25 protein [Nocardioides sp.]HEX5089433.1 glycoside hydrolase family 25 protein [Nocardioides sp.]